MGLIRSLTVLAVGAVLGGTAVIAYRISKETGKSLQEALADVPTELESLFGDIMVKGEEALERGRALYDEKQAEVTEHLREFTSAE